MRRRPLYEESTAPKHARADQPREGRTQDSTSMFRGATSRRVSGFQIHFSSTDLPTTMILPVVAQVVCVIRSSRFISFAILIALPNQPTLYTNTILLAGFTIGGYCLCRSARSLVPPNRIFTARSCAESGNSTALVCDDESLSSEFQSCRLRSLSAGCGI